MRAMVFGWKKAKKATQPSAAETPVRDIALGEIESILDSFLKSRRSLLTQECAQQLQDIRRGLDGIQDITKKLEDEALVDDGTDRHIEAIVERGKKQVIEVIKKATRVKISDAHDHNDVAETSREIARILKIIGDVLGRQTRVIHIFAKKYATHLKSILSDLNEAHAEIAKASRDHESLESNVSDLLERIGTLSSMRSDVGSHAGRIEKINADMQASRDALEEAKVRISQIESSAEFAEYRKTRESVGALETERIALDRSIADSFTKISRPLSKYVYVTSLDKKKKGIMQSMLNAPATALRDSGSDEVSDILNHVRNAVSSNSISVKDTAKSEEQLDSVSSELVGFCAKISDLDGKRSALEGALSSFDSSSLDSQRERLSAADASITMLESRAREVQADHDATRKSIPEEAHKIESDLRRITSVRYTLRDDA